MPIDREFRKARERGIDVGQVGASWAHYLSEERRKLRDNPRMFERHEGPDNLSVTQKSGASSVYWETLGELPHGMAPITVHANSFEAARNRMTLPQLLELRFKREFALGLIRAGVHEDNVDGWRAANRRAIKASVFVADLEL